MLDIFPQKDTTYIGRKVITVLYPSNSQSRISWFQASVGRKQFLEILPISLTMRFTFTVETSHSFIIVKMCCILSTNSKRELCRHFLKVLYYYASLKVNKYSLNTCMTQRNTCFSIDDYCTLTFTYLLMNRLLHFTVCSESFYNYFF